jgi:hypothetical protein
MRSWRDSLSQSATAFQSIKNSILPEFLDGKFISIEEEDPESIIAMMDVYSGVDIIRQNAIGLQGIAWRAQWERAYNTFTIRAELSSGNKTELQKRLDAIKHEYFYPAYTFQAYFDNPINLNCLSISMIKTKTLYEAFLERPDLFTEKTTGEDGNKFYCVNWSNLPTIKTLHFS